MRRGAKEKGKRKKEKNDPVLVVFPFFPFSFFLHHPSFNCAGWSDERIPVADSPPGALIPFNCFARPPQVRVTSAHPGQRAENGTASIHARRA